MEKDTSGFVIENNEPQPVEAETVEATEEEQTEEIKEEAKESETTPEPKQPKNRAQKRIEALIKEKHDLQRKLEEASNYRPHAEASEDLDPDDFDDYDDYLEAVEKQTSKPAKKEAKAETKQSDTFAETLEQLEAKFDDTREKHTDFDLKIRTMPILTEAMLSAINESDDSGDVAYYLANNPEEAAKMSAMSPLKMALMIGKIEAKLAEPTKKEAVIPKKTTKAPAPIEPVGGANGQPKSLYDTTDYSEYEAMRKAEQSKKTGWA